MSSDQDDEGNRTPGDVVPFPFSRVKPLRTAKAAEPVAYGAMAKLIGIPHEQATGHWCSRCNEIWYGYLLEVTCPTCGNRHG